MKTLELAREIPLDDPDSLVFIGGTEKGSGWLGILDTEIGAASDCF